MRKVWFVLMFSSLITLLVVNPEKCLNAMMNAGQKALELSIKLAGIYAVWLGFLAIADETKLSEKLANLMSPFIDFLFGKNLDSETKKLLAMNISCNILGLGNASTPTAISAMNNLDKQNKSIFASTPMIMLLVVNATSLQLLPTTIIGLRATLGSTTSSDIVLPAIITTFLTTFLGVLLVKFLSKLKFFNIKQKAKGFSK